MIYDSCCSFNMAAIVNEEVIVQSRNQASNKTTSNDHLSSYAENSMPHTFDFMPCILMQKRWKCHIALHNADENLDKHWYFSHSAKSKLYFKGIVLPKLEIMSSFAHSHVILDTYSFISWNTRDVEQNDDADLFRITKVDIYCPNYAITRRTLII